ncbi:MAG: SAM-dependent methyltransferase [Candidatus Micrarchaeia archaeon]|jgi:SAM-dependent MidA family methyltransferase
MQFLQLGSALKLANEGYYRSKGTRIYRDFDTVARCCPLVAQADAQEFASRKKGAAGAQAIYDFGIGEGSFAFDFLDEVRKRDEGLYGQTGYALCDISRKLLDEALKSERGKAHASRLKAVEVDASGPFEFSADYVRSNEMYDDLAASMLVMRKGKVCEVLFSPDGKEKQYAESGAAIPAAMRKMLEKCEGYELALNSGAVAHLRNAMKALKRGGWIDIYDYGYSGVEEILEEPAEVWNEGTVREYGGQLTVDVNFELLADEARACKCRAGIERVSERLEDAFGRKFSFVDLREGRGKTWVGYMDEAEVRKNAAMLKKAGYSKEFMDGEVVEEDAYLHLRIEKD